MGNQQAILEANHQVPLEPVPLPIISLPPPSQEPPKIEEKHPATLQRVEKVNVETVQSLCLPPPDIKLHSPKTAQVEQIPKSPSVPAFIPLKKNRSVKLMEEIRGDKQNLAAIEAREPSITKHNTQMCSPRTQPSASIEISDLRESENANLGELKEYRIKKIRVSRNSLCSPGAYF